MEGSSAWTAKILAGINVKNLPRIKWSKDVVRAAVRSTRRRVGLVQPGQNILERIYGMPPGTIAIGTMESDELQFEEALKYCKKHNDALLEHRALAGAAERDDEPEEFRAVVLNAPPQA